ncbi:MAG: hypothetical protein HC888_05255 [Candidatus Competibacteraceae bacterium]|nr:hypothetical protein [Candidatus Competibacteraceae bacterium]
MRVKIGNREWATISEACASLGCSRNTLKNHLEAGTEEVLLNHRSRPGVSRGYQTVYFLGRKFSSHTALCRALGLHPCRFPPNEDGKRKLKELEILYRAMQRIEQGEDK